MKKRSVSTKDVSKNGLRAIKCRSAEKTADDFIELNLNEFAPLPDCIVELEKVDGARFKATFSDSSGVVLLNLLDAFLRLK